MKLAQGGGGGGPGFGGWLLGQSEIVVRNAEIEWRDELRGAPPLGAFGARPAPGELGHARSRSA